MNGTLYLAWQVLGKEREFFLLQDMIPDFFRKKSISQTMRKFFGEQQELWHTKLATCLESDTAFILTV